MKMAFRAVFFLLCINAACLIIELADASYLQGGPITPMNQTQAISVNDIQGFIQSGDSANPVFYDLQVSLWMIWKIAGTIIAGFPLMVSDLGAPPAIVYPLYMLFISAWGVLILEMRAGRDITDD